MQSGPQMPAGFWVGELVAPWEALSAEGFENLLATPGGRTPDPQHESMPPAGSPAGAAWKRFKSTGVLLAPRFLEDFGPEENLAAIVIPGGYSPVAQLPGSAPLGSLLRAAMRRGSVIAAICHGPAALLAEKSPGKDWIFSGRNVTCFADAEEAAWLGERRPSLLVESALRESGARVEVAAPWSSHVVVDGNVVTGQNSPSCAAFTQALVVRCRSRA